MKTLFYKWWLPFFTVGVLLVQVAAAQKIKLTSGSNLVLSNSVSLVVMNGAIINDGTVVPGNSSSVYFKGDASGNMQGAASINVNNLYVDNSASMPLTITTPVSVFGILGLANATSRITTNDQLTLKSTSLKTAMVSAIPNGGNISGKVTVERFIQAQRAWRLLTVPLSTTGAPTIKSSWQEGASSASGNPFPGFGTHITSPFAPANGFDINPSMNASCKEFIAGSWVGIANTDVKKITDQPGYMFFVRGSRANNLSQGVNAATDNTVLRATGNLNIGDRSSYTVAASGFTFMGNPYAAPIDFGTITKSAHVLNTFYVWDPMLAGNSGVGGYVTVSYGAGSYDVTAHVSPINQYIQSGSAFFVVSDGLAGTITIKETDKAIQNSVSVQRPSGAIRQLRAELLVVNASAVSTLYDGVLVGYDDIFSNGIDSYDAGKLSNGLANISVFRNGRNFSIERRQPPDKNRNDTIFFNLSKMAIKNYSLQLTSGNLNYPNTIAWLEDDFLHTQTIVDLNGTTLVPFSVTSAAASSAANRFMIVFKNTGTLAAAFTELNATVQNRDIAIGWRVENEMDVLRYEIEKSLNGQQFEKLGGITATANSSLQSNYIWQDVDPGAGVFFYRIKQLNISGEIRYSKVVKIEIANATGEIQVNPNLIVDNIIKLQMNRQPKGNYLIQLKNNSGQLLFTKQLRHAGGSRDEMLLLDQQLPSGIYFLEITGSENVRQTIKLIK